MKKRKKKLRQKDCLRYTDPCPPERQVPVPLLPSDFLVIPHRRIDVGVVPRIAEEQSPLITGVEYFDDPFHTVLPPPPFHQLDPAWPQYLDLLKAAEKRIIACPPQAETRECDLAREAYFEAARQYAYKLDNVYGLNRLPAGQPETQPKPKPKEEATFGADAPAAGAP